MKKTLNIELWPPYVCIPTGSCALSIHTQIKEYAMGHAYNLRGQRQEDFRKFTVSMVYTVRPDPILLERDGAGEGIRLNRGPIILARSGEVCA